MGATWRHRHVCASRMQRGQPGRRDPRRSGCRAGPGVHGPIRSAPAVPAEAAGGGAGPVDPGAPPPPRRPRGSPRSKRPAYRRASVSQQPSDPVSPEVLLCLNGEVTVSSDGADVGLRGGQSAFLFASASSAVLASRGQVYRATIGRASPGSPQRDRPEPERLNSPPSG